jgi:hypothetical protein
MAIDFTSLGLEEATIYDVEPKEPYVLMVRRAIYKDKKTDLSPKSNDKGYRAISLWLTVMSGNLIGQDFWQMILFQGTGTSARFNNTWPIDAAKKLAVVLGRPLRNLPTNKDEKDTDLEEMAGRGFTALLRVREGTEGYDDTLEVARFLDPVDTEDIPSVELSMSEAGLAGISEDDLA